ATAEMIAPRGSEPGAGPPRTIWGATPRGRRASSAWLRAPVPHPRDMRTAFLLKLELGAPAAELARAQLAVFAPVFEGLQRAAAVTGTPALLAKNQMEIAVAPGNPHRVTAVADLTKPGLIVVLCASEAPCGKYADQLLEQDHVTLTPKSRELDVASTLTKVEN